MKIMARTEENLSTKSPASGRKPGFHMPSENDQKTITVLIAEDHELMRKTVRSIVDGTNSFEVIGEAPNGEVAVQMNRRKHPHVIVMDISMPKLDGIQATREIKKQSPDTRIVAFSNHPEAFYVKQMRQAGADAYVLKEEGYRDLVPAIKAALDKRVFVSDGADFDSPE
jgi:two-component system response regulator DegU